MEWLRISIRASCIVSLVGGVIVFGVSVAKDELFLAGIYLFAQCLALATYAPLWQLTRRDQW